MPLFEYQCLQCGKESEILIRTDELPKCEECGSKDMRKKISASNAIYKCPGFYSTDYRR